jgi:predicted TIM-barrel fold metal-dependent hydrolase
MITDAQVHVWELSRPDRPWPPGATSSGGTILKPNGFSAEEMLAEMDAIGVERAVIVPPAVVGFQNATALEAAARYPRRFSVMGLFDLGSVDAMDQLEGWLAQPGMIGIRTTTTLFPGPLDDLAVDWYWSACERLGIPVAVHVFGKTEMLKSVAERHPGLALIIDHLGAVSGATTIEETFAGLDHLLALARHARVAVKVTAAPGRSKEPYPHKDVQPYIRRIYDAFGPRRMLSCADLTTLRTPYSECLGLFTNELDFLSTEDKDWILGKAAAEALRWPEE